MQFAPAIVCCCLLLVTLSISSCAGPGGGGFAEAQQRAAADAAKRISPSELLDEATLRAHMLPGSGALEGVVYTSRGRFGWVKKLQNDNTFHASTKVTLLPSTPYTRAYLDLRRIHDRSDVQVFADDRLQAYTRTVLTDAYGRFRFEGLKPGSYLLLSDVFMRNGYTVDQVVGQGQNQFGNTTYTQQRRVDTSYTKLLAREVMVDAGASQVELNDY